MTDLPQIPAKKRKESNFGHRTIILHRSDMRESITDQYGRTIGHIEDNIFYTTRTKSTHLFRLFQSYGISVYVLDKLRHRGVTHIHITERLTPGERVLLSKLDLWLSSGKRYVDRGQDEQRHLPVVEMSVIS